MQLIVEYQCLVDWRVPFYPLNLAQIRAEKKMQGITPFARKSNLLASTLSGPTASSAWSWPRRPARHSRRRRTRVVVVEAGAGEATDRSRHRRLTVAVRAIAVGVRARTTFPSNHLGRHLGRLAGC